jgi:hypothetical protein
MFCDILEDHSPFYIKFSFDTILDFLLKCQFELKKHALDGQIPIYQRTIDQNLSDNFLNLLPFGNKFRFQKSRISYIITKPGVKHNVHIDRASISFNFGIDIKDEHCLTSWFDNELVDKSFTSLSDKNNRAIISNEDWAKNPLEPIKTLTQKQNECILFNSDIYHKFDNSLSVNNRIILTLRPELEDNVTFYDAREILFNF